MKESRPNSAEINAAYTEMVRYQRERNEVRYKEAKAAPANPLPVAPIQMSGEKGTCGAGVSRRGETGNGGSHPDDGFERF